MATVPKLIKAAVGFSRVLPEQLPCAGPSPTRKVDIIPTL
jgi:hypothetical protein